MGSQMREMKPIPVHAASRIAHSYGYDQVVIIARRVGEEPEPFGEHVTTYGVNKTHCDVAARMGDHFKYNVMGWERDATVEHEKKGDFNRNPDEPADAGTTGKRLPIAIWDKDVAAAWHASDPDVQDAWDAYAEDEARLFNDEAYGPDRSTATLHQWAPPMSFSQWIDVTG